MHVGPRIAFGLVKEQNDVKDVFTSAAAGGDACQTGSRCEGSADAEIRHRGDEIKPDRSSFLSMHRGNTG